MQGGLRPECDLRSKWEGAVVLGLSPSLSGGGVVVCAHDCRAGQPRWLSSLARGLEPAGLALESVPSGPETISRIERGNVAAALLVHALPQPDSLSLLRIIRGLDAGLPCWLVAREVTHATLQVAFALKAAAVLADPVDSELLALAMLKVLGRNRLHN